MPMQNVVCLYSCMHLLNFDCSGHKRICSRELYSLKDYMPYVRNAYIYVHILFAFISNIHCAPLKTHQKTFQISSIKISQLQ